MSSKPRAVDTRCCPAAMRTGSVKLPGWCRRYSGPMALTWGRWHRSRADACRKQRLGHHRSSVSARSIAPTSTSASPWSNGIGGRIFTTLWNGPSVPSRIPISRSPLATYHASAPAGSSVSRSRTTSHARDVEQHAGPSHVADERAPLREWLQSIQQALAHLTRVRLQPFVANHVERRQPDRARHRVSAERAEEFPPVVERGRDGRRRDHRANGVAAPERLAHHDDVRHDTLILERPEARSHATEAGLHLVSDADTSRGAHVPVHLRKVSAWEDDLPANARTRFRNEPRDA